MQSHTVKIPWSNKLSKNARMSFNRTHKHARPFIVQQVRQLQKNLSDEFRNTGPWYEAKVWLDIHVEMETRKSDAINIIDTVADAVKNGIGVDDKWFSIHRLDWSINKIDPVVTITVFQDSDGHKRFCSKCNLLYPLTPENFGIRRSDVHGLDTICRACCLIRREINRVKYHEKKKTRGDNNE